MSTTREDGRLATPAEAELQRMAWERDLNEAEAAARTDGVLPARSDPARGPSLLDLMDARHAALERDPTKSPSTATSCMTARKALATIIATIPVADVDEATVLEVRDALLTREGKPLRPVSVNTYMAQLKASWSWAKSRKLVPFPWPATEVKGLPRGPRLKRPYTNDEVRRVVEWVSAHQPMWLPIVALLADTGRRVGALVRLQGRDVDREACTVTVRDKGRGGQGAEVALVPVTPETMALLPEVPPDHHLFPRVLRGRSKAGRMQRGGADPTRHIYRGSVLRIVRLALEGIGVRDPERLDVHSLRRAFCAAAERAGVAADVGRRVTGHKSRSMWDHYQAEAVGDDLHEVVRLVREGRFGAASRGASRQEGVTPGGAEKTRSGGTSRAESGSGPAAPGCGADRREAPASKGATRRDRIYGRLDPDIATVTRWADENPAAMRRLLTTELRAAVLAALDDVVGGAPAQEAARG